MVGVLIQEQFKEYDVRIVCRYREVVFMFIVVVGCTSDFSIGCDLQIVLWRVNNVIIWGRGWRQVNVNYGGPLNWVKLAMIRVDERPVFIDEMIFVVIGWESVVVFHKVIPFWLSRNFAVLV